MHRRGAVHGGAGHHARVAGTGRPPCGGGGADAAGAVRRGPRPRRTHGGERGGPPASTTPSTGPRPRRCACCWRWPAGPRWPSGGTRCSPGATSTPPRTGRSSTWPCACRPEPTWWWTARTWWPTCTGCSTRWGTCPTGSATGGGPAPPAGASGPWSTSASAGSDLGPAMAYRGPARRGHTGHHQPVRLQHRPGGPVGQDGRPRPGRDAVRGELEDLHHPRDPHQRRRGPRLALVGARGRSRGGGPALRGRLHQPPGGGRVRDRPGQHARVLGLGGGPLLLRLGHRLLPHGGHRAPGVHRDAGRLPRHGRALPHGAARGEPAGDPGDAQRLVQQLLRGPDPRRAALQPAAGPFSRLPPAADHGIERQVGAPRRQPGGRGRPGRSSGGSPAPTASTPSTSCSTRARSSSRPTSSPSRTPPTSGATSRTC